MPSAPVPVEATVIASATPPAPQPAGAPPATQQPIVVQRSDDTWKRNVLFFLALCILLVLLGFLVRAFLDALNTDDEAVDEPDPTTETVTIADFTDRQADQAVNLIELAGLIPELEFEPTGGGA